MQVVKPDAPNAALNAEPSKARVEVNGYDEADRLMSQTMHEAHEEMLDELDDLGWLLAAKKEAEFCARLPAFMTMSFSWLNGAAFYRSDRDDPYHDYTLLGMACENGLPRAVEALLSAGASQKSPVGGKNDALHLVGWYRSEEQIACARALIRAGGDINKPNPQGDAPLDLAMQANNPEMCSLLLANGALARADTDERPGVESEALKAGALSSHAVLVAWRELQEIKMSLLERPAESLKAVERLRV